MSRKLYFAGLDEKYIEIFDDDKTNTIVIEIDVEYEDKTEWEILKIIIESLEKDPRKTAWKEEFYNFKIERV